MQISALILGFIIFGAALAYVCLPFRLRLKENNRSKLPVQSKGQKEAVLSALRDLEFDFKTGKVSEEDYLPLRAQLMTEAAQYIEAEKNEEDQLEALIQSRRKPQQPNLSGAKVNHKSCPACGKKIYKGDLFCSSCGTKLEVPLQPAVQS